MLADEQKCVLKSGEVCESRGSGEAQPRLGGGGSGDLNARAELGGSV